MPKLIKYSPLNTKARKEKHISQAKLSEMMGINKSTLIDYEKGYTAIPSDMLIKYAKICGVSTDYVLGLIDFKSINSAQIHEKIGLSEESISMLENHVMLQDNAKIHILDFLLRKKHIKAIPKDFSGRGIDGANDLGLLNLITHYLIDDGNSGVKDLPCITSILNSGSSLEIDSKLITKGVLLNLITETLVSYKAELLKERKRKRN